MNANKINLEEQTYRFIEFLKSEEFSTKPNLRKFHIELVNFYLAALNHGLHFKKEQRKFNINSLIAKDIESGIFEKKKEITFSKNIIFHQIVSSYISITPSKIGEIKPKYYQLASVSTENFFFGVSFTLSSFS